MSDQDQALAIHNSYREDANQNHGSHCLPLVWDATLVNHAQQWANHLASIDQLIHSGFAGEGENLFEFSGQATLANAAQGWCDEIKNYSGQPIGQGDFESYGHYTQIVWPSTTHVGMAAATAANGHWYVVARYSPPGNFVGQSAWGNAGSGPGNPAHQDGVYLVNSYKGAQSSSGFAYYSNINAVRPNQRPDAYIDISTKRVVIWEGHSFSGTGTYPDKNTFTCIIDADGQTAPFGKKVGTAKNNFHSFDITKAINNVLYTVDGWQVHAIYKCS